MVKTQMKKFTIHFEGKKFLGRQNDPNSKTELVDEWEDTIQSDGPPAIWHLTDFVYSRHGIPGAHFSYVPSSPGLFRAFEQADSKGRYNSRGRFITAVEVKISVSRNDPTFKVGTLNCQPEH